MPLEKSRQQELLQEASLPLEIRARLGDGQAESQLIRHFREAKEYGEKSRLAGQLGYVGSKAGARALVGELNSPLVWRATREHISIRCPIILALGRIHPDELLVTARMQQIIDMGDDRYGQRKVQEFVREVARWARKALGIELEPAALPVLYKRLIIERPIGR